MKSDQTKKAKRIYSASAPVEPFFEEQMRDPEYRAAYEALDPEFQIIRQIIDLRLKRKMSQAELASKMGTKQPSVARMERRGKTRGPGLSAARGRSPGCQIGGPSSTARGKRGQGHQPARQAHPVVRWRGRSYQR